MQKTMLCEYSFPEIKTDYQEESYQAVEYEKMFGDDSASEVTLESYSTIPVDDVVLQLQVNNALF